MKLEQLMEDVPFTLVQGTLETEVEDIIYDSRKAAPGLLFVCICLLYTSDAADEL